MSVNLAPATPDDLAAVLDLVRRYHAFEAIAFDENAVTRTLAPLLQHGEVGRIWLIERDAATIGYVALCFGYSIELGGRDAFVDEMYILEEHRGEGIGKAVLAEIQTRARSLGVKALHLEVERGNDRARKLYLSLGFQSRERFHLMTCML